MSYKTGIRPHMKSTVFKTPTTVQITSATAEFEQHALHVWAQMEDRPNTARFGYNLDAGLFWQKMRTYFKFGTEDVHSAHEYLASDDGELVNNFRYLIRLADGLYMSCMEYTQDAEFAPWESVQMLPRRVADIALFYADKAVHEVDAVTNVLYMMRLPEQVDGTFSVATSTPFGYKAQLSVQHTPDPVDVSIFYGTPAAELLDMDALPRIIGISGPLRTGKTSFMHLMMTMLREQMDVLYIPKQLYPVVDNVDFINWVLSTKPGAVAFDDAQELVDSGAMDTFTRSVTSSTTPVIVYNAVSVCEGHHDVAFNSLTHAQAKFVSEAIGVACDLQEDVVVTIGDIYGYAPDDEADGVIGYDVSSVR